MTDAEFQAALAAYQLESKAVAKLRHQAAVMELDRSQWVTRRTAELIADGMAKSPADKEAHADEQHRTYQRDVADLSFEAAQAEGRARSNWLACRWEIAGRESGRPALEG